MAVAPPPPQDELEALIPEARSRQRKRWMIAAMVVAAFAGSALGIYSIVSGTSSNATVGPDGGPALNTHNACGIQVRGVQILHGGQLVYREPGRWTHSGNAVSDVKCSGSSVWVVWLNGAAMMQQAYFGVRSGDGGRTWRAVFTERYFDLKAPHELDSYFGPWTLRGRVAYFAGSCPACSVGKLSWTVSLFVTKDGGRTFDVYKVPALNGYSPTGISVSGHVVSLTGKRFARGVVARHKTAKVRVT